MKERILATPDEQWKEIQRGTVEIIPEEEFRKKLEASYREQKPLKIKFGADPTRPDIHLGHTVVLQKLRQFQDFGHQIYFLIGDFTALIGDPTGRKTTRPQLSPDEVLQNAKTYQDQVFKILDPQKTQTVFNRTWLEGVRLNEFLQILMTTTLVQILSREDFSARFEAEQPIYLHEFMYPILQGYDSVALKADIELGGTDQKFNLLMGRHLQKAFQQPQQAILTMPLLEGLDGVQKMSKSFDNTIGMTDSAKDIFGKIMSISDVLMFRYYELLSSQTTEQISRLQQEVKDGSLHPMVAKKQLAEEIVDRYHGRGKGAEERIRFEEFFSKKNIQVDVPLIPVSLDAEGKVNLIDLIVSQQFAKSRSEARRLLQQKAVRLNQEVVQAESVALQPGVEVTLKSGKLNVIRFIPSEPASKS